MNKQEIFKEEQDKFFNELKKYEEKYSEVDKDGDIIDLAVMPHKGYNFSMSYNALENAMERYAQQRVNEVLDKAEKEMFNRIGGIATPDSISGSMQVISEIILKLKNNETD